MENTNDKMNRRIEDTLNSFDGMKKAAPAPFLLTRIHAKMQEGVALSLWDKITLVLSRPSVAFAGLLVLLIINISIISVSKGTGSSSVQQEISQQPADDAYAYGVTSIYNFENTAP